jgi:hypothetical protein
MTTAARLQQLIHRTDKVLAVLHPPTAAHARSLHGAGRAQRDDGHPPNATPTFGIFATGSGTIADDPAGSS